MDYIKLGYSDEAEITYIPNMNYLLPGYQEFGPSTSTPEAFKNKYFSKKRNGKFD